MPDCSAIEAGEIGAFGLSFVFRAALTHPDFVSLQIVILAAGLGKRMRSELPKVLHPLGGRPLLAHVLDAARALRPARIVVVVGHGGGQVRAAFPQPDLQWAIQDPPHGTGHAVQQALPLLDPEGSVLVLNGDVPLIQPASLLPLREAADAGRLAIQTQVLVDATGYGRIVRDVAGCVLRIVEHKDASADERKIGEMYTGIMAAPAASLARWVGALSNHNEQGEYYLTDVIAMAAAEGVDIATAHPAHQREMKGVNSKAQLADAERALQRALADALLERGVTLADPARIDIRGTLDCGRDVTIDINTVFGGHVELGNRVTIGAHCVIRDCRIGEDTVVQPFTHLEGVIVGAHCDLGPFAHVHPDTELADGVEIGNFVEVKRSRIGAGSKAKHLSYIGDATIGRNVNVGAGLITCNYDGANKHRTVIEDEVHTGSATQLVAPVTIGKGATIAAGTTIWKDVPPGGLVANEKRQQTRPEWKRPVKKPKRNT
ncbi:MAG: bifunctional UDP-N-acetylglucosamine diphosphorylase/glucosamine-1-phosphate N-acetyltransferase GlmU [Betaproteobacteria bacterium]|nr:bifunctional UDP-N-acetylglucosamine diphosphorylase/glucosamine-1-phosphate N-acetyltransferase GlmU [Betaproteobacteria bacterium]